MDVLFEVACFSYWFLVVKKGIYHIGITLFRRYVALFLSKNQFSENAGRTREALITLIGRSFVKGPADRKIPCKHRLWEPGQKRT